MTDVIVVGGGAAGLSAGLFTAKNDLETVLFDTDETWLHSAHLYNYLGIESVDGSQFAEDAREHAESHGVDLREAEVTSVSQDGDGFSVEADGETHSADYVVLATGSDRSLAEELGCATTDDGLVDVDLSMETSVDGAYATGAMIRQDEWQAIISAGDGAAAALSILTEEEGERVHDWDVPDED
jgi:thioredoxin reductase (NADPH)